MKSNGPVTSNCLDRRAIVQQRQKLDLGGAQIHFRGLHIGFELHALQLQPIEIHLRDIAGFISVATDCQHVVPVSEVLLGQRQHGLCLQRLHECVAQAEKQRSLQIGLVGFGNVSGFLRAFETQLPLVVAFVQIADRPEREGVSERTVDVSPCT